MQLAPSTPLAPAIATHPESALVLALAQRMDGESSAPRVRMHPLGRSP
jgi:hypothetical protein